MSKQERLTIAEIHSILETLQKNRWNALLVGGQAINVWAEHFREKYPEQTDWDQHLPFNSEDIDYLGGPVELLTLSKLIPGKPTYNRDFLATPNAGVFIAKLGTRTVRIDMLTYLQGIDSSEAEYTALTVKAQNGKLNLRVLHPLLCLQSKAANFRTLSQKTRQDKKHLLLAQLILKQFLTERLAEPRKVFPLIKRVFAASNTQEGLYAFEQGISLEDALPLKEISTRTEDAYQKFTTLNLPQLQNRLQEKRKKHRKTLAAFFENNAPKTQDPPLP